MALEVMYIGTRFQGFARQDSTDNTIEASVDGNGLTGTRANLFATTSHDAVGMAVVPCTLSQGEFFKALAKTRLIAPDADICSLRYSRCGRTDKGVSALGQVVALMLRSNGRSGDPSVSEDAELDYTQIINSALTPEIRVLGWITVPTEFNARYGR